MSSGTLPAGLTLSAAGVLGGTPTTPGTYNFTVQATGGGTATKAFAMTVDPGVYLSEIAVSPSAVVGGTSTTGTVTLYGRAPTGGAVVTLSSSNTSVATVPGSVTVPEGSDSATFPIATSVVTSSTSVTVYAVYGGGSRKATLTVRPWLSSVSVATSKVVGGTSTTGTVTLYGRAPTGGAVVTLSSSNISVATVPGSVTVPEGFDSATFPIATSVVTSPTSVTVYAVYGGVTRTDTFSVRVRWR